jgi:hypothetical protein
VQVSVLHGEQGVGRTPEVDRPQQVLEMGKFLFVVKGNALRFSLLVTEPSFLLFLVMVILGADMDPKQRAP